MSAITMLELDQSLVTLEELLLFELDKARNLITDQVYVCLNEKRLTRMVHRFGKLEHRLNHDGNTKKLELVTVYHEQIRARLVITKILLGAKQIGSAYMEVAHQDVIHSRSRLEKRVIARRQKLEARSSEKGRKTGVDPALIPTLTDEKRKFQPYVSTKEKGLNRLNITPRETSELEDVNSQVDISIYSAARELKILVAYLRFHKGKTPPLPKGRAYFVSKELSYNLQNDANRHLREIKTRQKKNTSTRKPEIKKKDMTGIAQTPEAIRKKLEQRGKDSIAAGPAIFESRDIFSVEDELGESKYIERRPVKEKPPPAPPKPPPRDPDQPIAQTPKEIRRKLDAREQQSGAQPKERAVFESRDLSSE